MLSETNYWYGFGGSRYLNEPRPPFGRCDPLILQDASEEVGGMLAAVIPAGRWA